MAPPAGDASETNGNVYYVITQGAGMGDGVYRFPITGNVTVRDALSRINGLDDVSSKKIWIARAGRNQEGANQILPVDGVAIEKNAASEMNYLVIPGDRIFIAEDKLIGYGPAKIISPFERIMGFAMPGTDTVTRFSGKELRGGGNSRNSF